MRVRPIQYLATDYPPQYRPLGYWAHEEPPGPPPAPSAGSGMGRRKLLLIVLAVITATLVLHAGIAFADVSRDSGATTQAVHKSKKASGGSCDAESGLDDEQSDLGTEGGSDAVDGSGSGTGSGQGRSSL